MKAISPLLAAVLLIAVTVAIATLITGWISTVTRGTQIVAENKTLSAIECAAASIVVDDVYISQGSNGTARIILRNSGQTNDLQIVSAELYDKKGNNFTATNAPITDFDRGELATLEFRFPILPNTTVDSSNYGNNGTLGTPGTSYKGDTADPTWTLSGKVGGAMSFDGADDYVNITGTEGGVLNITSTNLTIEAWINLKSVSVANQEVLFKGSNAIFSYSIRTGSADPSTIQFHVSNITANRGAVSNTQLSASVWYHIAGTYNGSQMRLFINGILEDSIAMFGQINSTNSSVTIGRDSGAPVFFNGTTDEIAIWNRTLTDLEINSSMNSGVLSVTNIDDLVGYWKFDDASGVVNCPEDFSKVLVSTNCGGISAEFAKTPKC